MEKPVFTRKVITIDGKNLWNTDIYRIQMTHALPRPY